MTDEIGYKERLEIRKKIQMAGNRLYESIENRVLQNIAGELMAKNEDFVLNNKDTFGAVDILNRGFTTNQRKWLKELDKKLEAII